MKRYLLAILFILSCNNAYAQVCHTPLYSTEGIQSDDALACLKVTRDATAISFYDCLGNYDGAFLKWDLYTCKNSCKRFANRVSSLGANCISKCKDSCRRAYEYMRELEAKGKIPNSCIEHGKNICKE